MSFRRQYLIALKELVRETLSERGERRLPSHLRVAVRSHARRIAQVRIQLGVER